MPPKKSKQTAHNSFYYFMLELKNKQGRKFSSMAEVSIAAGPLWHNMSKEQRAPYEAMAQREKASLRNSKLTSEGYEVEYLEKEQEEELERKQQAKEEINQLLKIAKKSGHLEHELLFIIHMNSFCREEKTKRFYPAEVAICGFNLLDGVTEHVFHRMIKPGRLPLGYAGIAKTHSEGTHQIDIPLSDDEVEDNTLEVFQDILDFLRNCLKGSSRIPILYAREEKDLEMVTSVLQTWCYEFNQDVDLFKIYSLQAMFMILYNTCAGQMKWTSDTPPFSIIEKDVYNYTPGLACDFHEMADVIIYCSKSVVIRYAFLICDYCCPLLGIPLDPGYHVPVRAKISKASSVSGSETASAKGSSSSQATVRDDTDTDTIISIGKSSRWDDSASQVSSSIDFGDLDNFPSLGRSKTASSQNSMPEEWGDGFSPADSSSQRSYAGTIGHSSSGFSRRPAALPHTLTHGMNSISIGNPQGSPDDFPMLGGKGRGRITPGSSLSQLSQESNKPIWARGRGSNPFKRPQVNDNDD